MDEAKVKAALEKAKVFMRTLELGAPLETSRWPKRYFNKEDKCYYDSDQNPYIKEFIYTDTPLYVLAKGGEGCMHPDTEINGVSIGDLAQPSIESHVVPTLFGLAPSSRAFLKGRKDLYRLRTEFGQEVKITVDHRFLTPNGWRRLADLRVGAVIAVDGDEHGSCDVGKSKDYQDHYYPHPHQYDVQRTPKEAAFLEILQQFSDGLCDQAWPQRTSHLSIGNCSHRYGTNEEILQEFVGTNQHASNAFSHALHPSHISDPICKRIPPAHRALKLLQWEDNACWDASILLQYLLSADDLKQNQCKFSKDPLLAAYSDVSSKDPLPVPYLWTDGLSQDLAQLHGLRHRLYDMKDPTALPSSSDYGFLGTNLLSGFCQSPPYTNICWGAITSINFAEEGEYYDLTVPLLEHYQANGIYHHNSGKSAAGVIKVLERLRHGMSGIMCSPTLPHLKKSLWPVFRNWCPLGAVVPKQQFMLAETWDPSSFFIMHFISEAGKTVDLYIGGTEDPLSWDGANVSFAHIDEARKHDKPDVLKVFAGRTRKPGPNGEPPQIWLTTTPRKHWLYDYFGGIEPGELPRMEEDDPKAAFKNMAKVITLKTIDNKKHLSAGYIEGRVAGLSSAEARVLMDAAWEDIADSDPYLEDIRYWDNCEDKALANVSMNDFLVVALDGAVSGDSFGLVAVSPHTGIPGTVVVRGVKEWNPKTCSKEYLRPDKTLDFSVIEEEVRSLIKGWNVIKLVYDPHELHYFSSRLSSEVLTEKFSQSDNMRCVADKQLRDMILQRRIAHAGEPDLRRHLFNANKKVTDDRKIRIVKREDGLKIDLAVCLSMATYGVMEYVPAVVGHVSMGSNNVDVMSQLFELL